MTKYSVSQAVEAQYSIWMVIGNACHSLLIRCDCSIKVLHRSRPHESRLKRVPQVVEIHSLIWMAFVEIVTRIGYFFPHKRETKSSLMKSIKCDVSGYQIELSAYDIFLREVDINIMINLINIL